MAIVMILTLYMSRLLLEKLGVEDFGIYGIVGGVVTLCSYLTSALTVTTQRFINYEVSSECNNSLIKVFSASINIHLFIAFFIFLLAETVGLYFLNGTINVPIDRLDAANWVYQMSLFSVLFQITTLPFSALVTANENFTIIAYVSIIEVVLKLISVVSLSFFSGDNLVEYSFLIMLVTILSRLIYIVYCCYAYSNVKYRLSYDKLLTIKMLKFTAWNFMGATAGMTMNQGVDILLNLFFGPIANASRLVAIQIQNAFSQLATNITTAVSPQIIKSYSSGNIDYMSDLVNSSTRYTILVLSITMMPFLVNMDFVLDFWLNEVPLFASDFSKLLLIYQLTVCLTLLLNTASQASGRVMLFQIVEASILIFVLPIGWYLMKNGFPAITLFVTMIVLSLIALFVKLFVLSKTMNFNVSLYINKVVKPLLKISVLLGLVYFIFTKIIYIDNNSILLNVFHMVCVLFISILIIAIFGISRTERNKIKYFILTKLKLS